MLFSFKTRFTCVTLFSLLYAAHGDCNALGKSLSESPVKGIDTNITQKMLGEYQYELAKSEGKGSAIVVAVPKEPRAIRVVLETRTYYESQDGQTLSRGCVYKGNCTLQEGGFFLCPTGGDEHAALRAEAEEHPHFKQIFENSRVEIHPTEQGFFLKGRDDAVCGLNAATMEGNYTKQVTAKNVDSKKVTAYKQILKSFPSDTKPLGAFITLAQKAFFKTFTKADSVETRHAAFKVFYAYYMSILTTINDDNDGFLASLNANNDYRGTNYGKRFGFLIEHAGEGSYVASPNYEYIKKTFKNYLPEEFTLYFSYFEKHPVGYMYRDIKNHDGLREAIMVAEKLITKYPKSEFSEQMKNDVKFDVRVYISGIDNYPIGVGEPYSLNPIVKASFEKFLKQNKDSKFYDIVQAWYKRLQENNFIIDNDFNSLLIEKIEKMDL